MTDNGRASHRKGPHLFINRTKLALSLVAAGHSGKYTLFNDGICYLAKLNNMLMYIFFNIIPYDSDAVALVEAII